VRPHEFDISRTEPDNGQTLPATIDRLLATGPQIRLELTVPGSPNPVSVELSRARSRELDLHEGDEVFLSPQEIRIFHDRPAGDPLLEQGAGI